jgi:hypothetical protein
VSGTIFVVLLVVSVFVWFVLTAAAKDAYGAAKTRRDTRIMAEYERREEARQRLYDATHPRVTYKETTAEAAARARDARGDYLVIYHPHKQRPFVHGRYNTYDRAAARCDELQPKEEYTEVGKEVFVNGWAIVQSISGLAQTSDGRQYLHELGIEVR